MYCYFNDSSKDFSLTTNNPAHLQKLYKLEFASLEDDLEGCYTEELHNIHERLEFMADVVKCLIEYNAVNRAVSAEEAEKVTVQLIKEAVSSDV